YVLEFDEYTAGTTGQGSGDDVGAGRIIDIADEHAPKVVSNLRLQVNQPKEHAEFGSDPGASGEIHGGVQGYAAHYCNIPTRVNPTIVACSFIVSGLRLFDISDVTKPKEIGYYVAPTTPKVENGAQASDFAMSQPTIVPERHEVWFTDGATGFYVLRVADAVWPKAASAAKQRCAVRRHFTMTLPPGAKVRGLSATLNGKHLKVHQTSRKGRRLRVVVVLPKSPRGAGIVRVRVRMGGGKVQVGRRPQRACAL
ncbi:MAG: hypothetical protein QOG68_1015, partial [Solirubrobacteraceae bacterium]|nr:hypothetical protein [Solirubrobacteraceae bacterium]